MINHAGQVSNQLQLEEHDGLLNAKKVSLVSGATIFAVVNTSAGGAVTVKQGDSPWINSIPSGVTVYQGTQPWNSLGTMTTNGLVTLASSPNFIGIVTVANQPPLVASAAYIGLITVGGIGTLTLSDPKGFIGLATTVNGAGDRFIGLVTNVQAGLTTLAPSPNFIGITTIANQPPLVASAAFIGIVTIANQPALVDSVGKIGFVTVAGIGTVTLADPKGYIGLVTVGGIGLITLGDPKGFIGLVTTVIGNASVATKNAGTTKTIKSLPILISTGSAATVYVPTNTFYITNILLSSNSTVRVNVRSGATYLTGNASLGINLNPGGGFVNIGAPDSPIYAGLAAAAPIVIEKADSSGVISQIGGSVTFFDE